MQIHHFTPIEKLARFQLIRTDNVGPVTFRHLLSRYKTAVRALDALPELARRGGRNKILFVARKSDIEKEIDALSKAGGTLIVYGDNLYPRALMATEDAPPVLMALGHTHLLDQKNFAMVGARNCSAVGLKLATSLARDMGQAGYVISSGMARGIDTAVHQGALESGTIAVLAGGADIIYPRENNQLYEAIKSCGLILSEMPLGTQPTARHFPRRNRIISGLAAGLLVVEATHKSGSLITARLALEQGREVFAIPGSPLDPRAKGPNDLIRQGAVLVDNVENILDVLQMMEGRTISEPQYNLFDNITEHQIPLDDQKFDLMRQTIRDKLSPTAIPVDDLIRITKLSPAEVQSVLLELELAGEISRYPGNRVAFF
ncbi:MAG: DNA-protecting protein DprA [Alphaproteobacteria bacterium]|nr:MAG: DNA-protecting protein DprA [Alphaproteobacteria bacterium]